MPFWKRRGTEISLADAGNPAACAIITRDFLPHARVLAESFSRHHPTSRFYLLVLGALPAGVDAGRHVRVLDASELVCPYFWEMAVRYEPFELSCALKPFLVTTVLERFGEKAVYYFDSDILVQRRLVEAEKALARAEILLTPHVLHPIDPDGKQPDEPYVLSGGVFNMGFFAVRDGDGTRGFLKWWSSRLRAGCVSDLAGGIYHDQRWIDLVLPLFPSAAILRDETYNVAYWNLHQRRLERSKDRYDVNGRPLAFFHFSGIDLDTLEFKRSHQDRIVVAEYPAVAALVTEYAAALTRHGRDDYRSLGNGIVTFDNGLPFHPVLRKLYLALDERRRQAFGNPFATQGVDSFFAWAVRPDPLLSPFLQAVYAETAEARERFPVVEAVDYSRYIEWARTEGARALGFSPDFVQHVPQ